MALLPHFLRRFRFALACGVYRMPGLDAFGPLIDRTQHRSFVPKIPFVGKSSCRRAIILIVFVVLAVIGYRLSSDCPTPTAMAPFPPQAE